MNVQFKVSVRPCLSLCPVSAALYLFTVKSLLSLFLANVKTHANDVFVNVEDRYTQIDKPQVQFSH